MGQLQLRLTLDTAPSVPDDATMTKAKDDTPLTTLIMERWRVFTIGVAGSEKVQAATKSELFKLMLGANEALGTLSAREQRVLRLRFGLDDGRHRTLEEVGASLNVTRERIRQIEAKALRKLRHPPQARGSLLEKQ